MQPEAARTAADWLAEGDARYDAQRWDEAGAALERALALEPSLAHAWYRLGNVREEQGRDAEAEVCFEKAVALDPSHAQAWNNLGGARQRLGREQPAIEAFRTAMAADPSLPQPYLNLGRLCAGQDNYALAAECFRTALEHHPGDPVFQHLLAAASGKGGATVPRAYVTALYDGIAQQFEHHLVDDLKYRVPEALATLARPMLDRLREAATPARVVDLGCGTGLVGLALAGSGARIIGVDLSPRMLEIATRHGVYERLEQGDLVEVLEQTAAASIHAVFAADVFIYFGALEAVFAAVRRVLAPGGLFAFSVEATEQASYRLGPSGRFAHSPGYLRALAAQTGLEERRLARTRIRFERRANVEGWLALLARPVTGV